MVAYNDEFKLMLSSLAALPLVLLLEKGRTSYVEQVTVK